jgi:putative heme-binding domain-containing protein
MITNQRSFPAIEWPEQAYVQIDQVGRFTAAAGCAIYEGGAWPAKWNYSYFTTEPTLNLVHHQFVRPDGVSYAVEKETGREETEFMRSKDLWFRPIETRVGPDGALYVIDFYNQAVIHNDTRGPQHGPANAAVRPDRDHYFGRIWRVQHKDAKQLTLPAMELTNLASLMRAIETSPNAHVKKTAWRLAQENHPGARELAALKKPMGSPALARYESARTAVTPAQRATVLADFAAATDDWTRSALIAAAKAHPADFLADALTSQHGGALGAFVTALAPSVPPPHAARLVQAAAASPGPLGARLLRGLSELGDQLPAFDAATSSALQKLLNAADTAAPALLLTAKADRSGTLADSVAQAARRLLADFADARTPDARRAEIALSLLALPPQRADALARIGALLADPAAPDSVKATLLAAVGELPGPESANVLIGVFVQSQSAAIFEQLLKYPASARALIAAVKDNRISPAVLGPGNIARLRTHPNTRVANEAAAVFAAVNPPTKQKDDLIATLHPEVQKPGDATNGRALFAAACAICHKFGDVGLREVGPPLAGIGARTPAELLTAIVDPNRQIEPNFWQWNITTKKGEIFVGVIVNENNATITLRNQGGDTEVRKDEITGRENTRRSLMPEGFEGLGAAGLRDLVAYLAAGAAAAPISNLKSQISDAPADGPKAGGKGDRPLPAPTSVAWEPGKTKVLLIGGGSSHDFTKFFGDTDSATLKAAGCSVHYTEDRDQAAAELAHADVAVISVNRKFFDTPAYRKAVFDFAAAGKGIVMLHPGTWYGYVQWPQLNAQIVGGGARGHDKIAKYSVNALQPDHPVMKGVPASFEVEDELYYINAEPDKIPADTSPIVVLAETSPSVKFKRPHPVAWITRHEQARIVGFTLGHDERVHDHPAYRTILINAVKWVGRSGL